VDTLGLTSKWVAAARARESARPDHLFEDAFAADLAGDEGRAMLDEMEQAGAMPGKPLENPFLAIRTRFLDDLLLAETAKGTRQIVLLAAGMDARALRLAWPPGTTVFEVERADVLDHKEAILAVRRPEARARRILVRADLRDEWRASLRAAGHAPAAPTAFLVEGLLPYLPDEAAAHAVLSAAASIAAPGSVIGFDVIGQSLLASPWVKTFLDTLAARGIAWLFGTDEPEALLTRAGWPTASAVSPIDVSAAAGRWPYPPTPRGTPGIPQSFFVVGRR
jgi:methyltransferase (TIGR00027 family)